MAAMELVPVYATDWPQDLERKRRSFRCVRITWSSLNQVAFTSNSSGDGSGVGNKKLNDCSYIHIFDPDKPWDLHSMLSGHMETVTDIQWDPSGHHLLSVDSVGTFKLWSMKNNLTNSWHCEKSHDVGEKVISMMWLGTSTKFLFSDVPKDLTHLMATGSSHSFARNKAKHPLANFCGVTKDGWLAVTQTGKVCFVSMNPDIGLIKIQLDTDLRGIQAADIAFSNDGHVIVGVSDGLVGSVARFYKVMLKCTASNMVNITCSVLQTLSPSSNRSFHPFAITHLKFVYRNSGTHVFICSKGLLESSIERWKLTKEPQQLHELCQKQQPHKKPPPPTKTWLFLARHVVRKHIASLAIPWLPVDPDKNQNYPYPRHNLIVGFADGHVRALNSWNLEVEAELKSLDNFIVLSHQTKRLKTSFCGHSNAFLSLHYSPCSCCIVGITGSGAVCLLKCQQSKAISRVQIPMTMVNLLHFCLLSGRDWWDVIVELKHQHADVLNTTLKLFEQDFKSLPYSQVNRKFLSIKASLLSLCRNSDAEVMDCYSKQFLLALGNFMRSLVPTVAERLPVVCQRVADSDLETIYQSFDMKEFEVDPAVLKSLHPLTQWLSDLTLIGILNIKPGREDMPGASLLRDGQCVLLLKQLLLLVLIWSKQLPGILPNCVGPIVAEKHDYLAHLFKLVSRLWMVNNQAMELNDFENATKDLELYFANHLVFLYHSMLLSPANPGITGKQAYTKPGDVDEYEFGEKPRDRMWPLKLLTSQYCGNIDVVTKLYLGNVPRTKLRECSKCHGISLLTQGRDSLSKNAWEEKWTASCVCGGTWKLAEPL